MTQISPPPPPPPPPPGDPTVVRAPAAPTAVTTAVMQRQPRSRMVPWLIGVGVVAAAVIGAAVMTVVVGGDDDEASATSVAPSAPATAAPTGPTEPIAAPRATVPATAPATAATAPPVAVNANPIVFPYEFFAVPPLGPEPDARGSGCDIVEMTDGLWHGFITGSSATGLSVDRVCARILETECDGSGWALCGYAIENKSDRSREFPLSAGFAVYAAQWTDSGCNVFQPSTLGSNRSEAVWIRIDGGQVSWVLRPCPT